MCKKECRQENEILDIHNLRISFTQYAGNSFRKEQFSVISDLNVTVREREIVAIVGSSGSGKSLLAHAVLGLLPENAAVSWNIRYRGQELGDGDIRQLRGKKIALVPQSVNYLDPLMTVGRQLTNGKKDAASLEKMRKMCGRYGLTERVERMYPFELSGGMARRVLLMTALMNEPELMIADEPTPGMDLALAKKAMGDFRRFADEGNGVLLITHDLQLAIERADRIVVFYAGTTVEEAEAADFRREELLRHPYTRALYRAMPEHGFETLPGRQPYAKEMPKGCRFAPRCAYRDVACEGEIPVRSVCGGSVRCIRDLRYRG